MCRSDTDRACELALEPIDELGRRLATKSIEQQMCSIDTEHTFGNEVEIVEGCRASDHGWSVRSPRPEKIGEYRRLDALQRQLFTLVLSHGWSAVANLRESDLSRIAVGDCATVYSMIDRRRPIRGTVQGIGAGVLDAERINLPRNLPFVQKSMNWVHVAQRFPVRVQLEDAPEPLLRLGASAVVEVRHGDACR